MFFSLIIFKYGHRIFKNKAFLYVDFRIEN